jgi:hypothetical protein
VSDRLFSQKELLLRWLEKSCFRHSLSGWLDEIDSDQTLPTLASSSSLPTPWQSEPQAALGLQLFSPIPLVEGESLFSTIPAQLLDPAIWLCACCWLGDEVLPRRVESAYVR